jgi:hypothetical protein
MSSSATDQALAAGVKLTMPSACLEKEKSRKTRCTQKGEQHSRNTASNRANYFRYVEMLEQQQTQLVAGLRELYSRLQKGESWPGQPLRESSGGHPLTHDILERLDLLHPSGDNHNSNYEGFEEDCSRMQQKLLERGAPFTHRRGSVSSDSEHGHASNNSPVSYEGTPTTRSFAFDNPFARHNAPPTPPMHSPFPRQSQIVSPPVKQESPMVSPTFMNSSAMNLPVMQQTPWMNDTMMMDEPVDFTKAMYGFDTLTGYDQSMMMDTITINPHDPMMPDWNSNADLDFNSFIQNPIGA